MPLSTLSEIQILHLQLLVRLPELTAALFPKEPKQITKREIRIGRKGSLAINRETGLWYSHEVGNGGDILRLIEYALRVDFRGALAYARNYLGGQITFPYVPVVPGGTQKADEARGNAQRAKAKALWKEAQPIMDGPAMLSRTYFCSRGIVMTHIPTTISHHPSIYNHTSKKKHPAVLCKGQDMDGNHIFVQAIFLTSDGRKISGDGVKAKLIYGSINGGAIRLSDALDRVTLCEGVEDGLSLLQFDPNCVVWATCGTSGLQKVNLPASIQHITIACDRDSAGERAALLAADRFRREGRTVVIEVPPAPFKDWNEVLMAETLCARHKGEEV